MNVLFGGHATPDSGVPAISRGINRHIYYLAKSFHKLNQDDRLLVRDLASSDGDWVKKVPTRMNNWFFYYLDFKRYLKSIKYYDFDVYHADYMDTGAAFVIGARNKVVVTFHDTFPWEPWYCTGTIDSKIRLKWIHRNGIISQNADALIFCSEDQASRARELFPDVSNKIHSCYNIVDTNVFKPELACVDEHVFRIGCPGGLAGRKNGELLLSTFNELKKDYNVELHTTVDLPGAVVYKDLDSDAKLNEFYNSMDCIAYPSLFEGFGYVPAEAMSAGKPVVALNRSAMKEVVSSYGVLADPETFKDSISMLIEDEKLRRSLGASARQSVLNRFSDKVIRSKMNGIYKSII